MRCAAVASLAALSGASSVESASGMTMPRPVPEWARRGLISAMSPSSRGLLVRVPAGSIRSISGSSASLRPRARGGAGSADAAEPNASGTEYVPWLLIRVFRSPRRWRSPSDPESSDLDAAGGSAAALGPGPRGADGRGDESPSPGAGAPGIRMVLVRIGYAGRRGSAQPL